MTHIISALFSFFFSNKQPNFDLQNNTFDLIKKNLRAELSALIFKTLAGLVVASTAIFSIIQLGKAFQVLFSRYENGLFFELATFATVSIISCGLLYYLFNDGAKELAAQKNAEKPAPNDFAVEGILAKFTEGIRQGLEAGHEKNSAKRSESFESIETPPKMLHS